MRSRGCVQEGNLDAGGRQRRCRHEGQRSRRQPARQGQRPVEEGEGRGLRREPARRRGREEARHLSRGEDQEPQGAHRVRQRGHRQDPGGDRRIRTSPTPTSFSSRRSSIRTSSTRPRTRSCCCWRSRSSRRTVLANAASNKITARSRRNTVVIGALIGLILGAIAALLWEPVARAGHAAQRQRRLT